MKNNPQVELPVLRREPDLLSDPRFAEWRSIWSRTITFYLRTLDLLGPHVSEARYLREQLDRADDAMRARVLAIPVLRSELSKALEQKRDNAKSYDESLRLVLDEVLSDFETLKISERAHSSTSQPLYQSMGCFSTFVLNPSNSRSASELAFLKLFDSEVADSISSDPAILRSPTAQEDETLRQAITLLGEVDSELLSSALTHVHTLAIVDTSDKSQWSKAIRTDLCQNVSTHKVPGTIFISPTPMRSAWHSAEAILHEALHKKLSDIILTRRIFRDGYRAADASTIKAVWNRSLSWNSNEWSTDRALFALHVYVYLAHYYLIAQSKEDRLTRLFPLPADLSLSSMAETCLLRASYLHNQLKVKAMEEDLLEEGVQLVNWLGAWIDTIDIVERSPLKVRLQLLLQRHDRETSELRSLFRSAPAKMWEHRPENESPKDSYCSWSLSRVGNHLLHSELVSLYRVLSTLGEDKSPTFAFYDADRWSVTIPRELDGNALAETLYFVRRFMSGTLSALSVDDLNKICYTRREKRLIDLVEDMVDHPAQHLDCLDVLSRSTLV